MSPDPEHPEIVTMPADQLAEFWESNEPDEAPGLRAMVEGAERSGRSWREVKADAIRAGLITEHRKPPLTDFLLARIAEDEQTFAGENWSGPPDGTWQERIARECEAKRQIVELHKPGRYRPYPPGSQPGPLYGCFRCIGDAETSCGTMRALAGIYADHPDYRDEWKP